MTKFKYNLHLSRMDNGVNSYYGFTSFTPGKKKDISVFGESGFVREPVKNSKSGRTTVFQFGTAEYGEGIITAQAKGMQDPMSFLPRISTKSIL